MEATGYVAVIPAFQEAATIRDVAERTLRQVGALIVVDDGSSDGTAAALEGLPLELLRNPANLGKGASLWRGMQRALELGARAVITLDGDGQHRPEDIPALLAAQRAMPEAIVIGSRLHLRQEIPPLRYHANRCGDFWVGLVGRSPLSRHAVRLSHLSGPPAARGARRAWRVGALRVRERNPDRGRPPRASRASRCRSRCRIAGWRGRATSRALPTSRASR